MEVCLSHVASYVGIARIVVGADSLAQLKEIIAAARSTPLRAPESLASPPSSLINPAAWSTL